MYNVHEYELSAGHSCCRYVGFGREYEGALLALRGRMGELMQDYGYQRLTHETALVQEGMVLLHKEANMPTILLKIEARTPEPHLPLIQPR